MTCQSMNGWLKESLAPPGGISPHLLMPRPLPVPFTKMMQEFKNLSSDLYWVHHYFSWHVISIKFTFQMTTTKNSQKGRIFSIESNKSSLKYSHLIAYSLYCCSLRSQDIIVESCWDLDLSTLTPVSLGVTRQLAMLPFSRF